MKTRVYLGLGGNEGQVLVRLQRALALLSAKPEISDLKISHFYQTAPIQVNSSSWFVNAVCSFQTTLAPKEVFEMTQAVENQLGKIKKPKHASRPIDIDLLFYGHQTQQDEELEIPHPRWKERLFVLIPLADLTQEIVLQREMGKERYLLQDLIQPLLIQTPQAVSLLEKNPGLQ
jgi:2-amino-4-hydroxy-6-hydroxymethyldihydropteridine diphosphokinase